MKKVCVFLAVMMILIGPAAVFAAGEAATSSAPGAAQAASAPAPTFQPKVIVSKTSVNPSPAVAGQEFTATITLQNTSDTVSVQNMTVTATCSSTNFTLENSSSTVYISSLANGQTTDITLKYKTDLGTAAQQYSIALAIGYDSANGTSLTAAGVVPVTISQPLNVQMDAPQIPAQVNAGDTIPLSFHVMNMGRSAIYNVRCELSAPGLVPSGTSFIGNINPGTSKQGTMDVFISTKASGNSSSSGSSSGSSSSESDTNDLYGLTSGKVTLIYDDAAGKKYTKDTEFSTAINAPVAGTSSAAPKAQPKKAGQWWVSILIGGVIIAGLATVLIVRRKKGTHHEDN
jgi:hypothetical protein